MRYFAVLNVDNNGFVFDYIDQDDEDNGQQLFRTREEAEAVREWISVLYPEIQYEVVSLEVKGE